MKRRHVILAALASGTATALFSRPVLAMPDRLEVFKSPTCGCCTAWLDHLAKAGFVPIAHDVDQDTLWSTKTRAGVSPKMSSCHTGFVDGYVIEGHVPAGDIRRLLSERPDALGLAVPGMPIGSPGMEMGDRRDPYDTFLLLRDGSAQVFEHHP